MCGHLAAARRVYAEVREARLVVSAATLSVSVELVSKSCWSMEQLEVAAARVVNIHGKFGEGGVGGGVINESVVLAVP